MNNPLRPRPSIGRFISPICLPTLIAIKKCFESAYFRNESRNDERAPRKINNTLDSGMIPIMIC
jgi:hypothetical protein